MKALARVRLPLPATQERGEGWGEGLLIRSHPCTSSPRPSPPFHGGEGDHSAPQLPRLRNNPGRIGRDKAVISSFSHDLQAAGAAVQRLEDREQHAFPVFPPFVIPKTKLLNVLRGEELFPRFVMLHLFRHTMLKTVQLHRQTRQRAEEIQVVSSQRMLAAEFESGEPPGPQSPPQFLFFVRLLTAQAAGGGAGIHWRKDRESSVTDKFHSLDRSASSPQRLPRSCSLGEALPTEYAATRRLPTIPNRHRAERAGAAAQSHV